jgi:hypothetical protein
MYQFIHIEMYARQAHKAKKSKWTARDIANEADRKQGACGHVKNPKAPTVLFGVSPSDAVDFAESEVAKETDGLGRRIRSDRAILLAGVASYPKDGDKYEEWKGHTLKWLKDRYGNCLRSVVEHTDEEHPHLHFYVVAEKPSKTYELHDGEQAADTAVKMGKKNEAGKAYRAGMKLLQDDFWQSVASKVGMARTGPKRARLSRDEWAKVKAENLLIADTLRRATIKEAEADEILETAFKEAEAKSKEATDVLRKASDTVRQAVRDKLGALVTEESRLEKWGAYLSKVDEKLKPQIEAAQKAYQSEGSLASRVGAKVAQSGGTTVEGLKSNSPNKPR